MDFFGFLFSAAVAQEDEIPRDEDLPCPGTASINYVICVIA